MTDSLDRLIQKHLDGRTSTEEAASLSARIIADRDVRSRYLKAAQIHGALARQPAKTLFALPVQPPVYLPSLCWLLTHPAMPDVAAV